MFRFGPVVSTIVFMALIPVASAHSQQPAAEEAALDSTRLGDGALQGLIINRTMTVIGWDFYKSFSQIWEALYPNSKDSLTVVERPTAQYGSEIWIKYGNDNVYHTFLSPARSRARDESKDAVEIAHKNIAVIEVQRKLTQGGDLAPEEM